MLLGLDFDNTLVSYDEVFRHLAIKERMVPIHWKGNKLQLRKYLYATKDGEFKWQKLQGQAYGRLMYKAKLFKGVKEFLLRCKTEKIPLCIISHKTIFGIHDDKKIPLRNEALKWMHRQGFFKELGINEDKVYFELTIEDKINRIHNLNCTYFIDDLLEIFTHPKFPKSVKRILFSDEIHNNIQAIHTFQNWNELSVKDFLEC